MDYSRIATVYQWLERAAFGNKLQRARTAHLDRLLEGLPATAHVLIIGDGDGRFLEALLERSPRFTIVYVEPCATMIALAQARVEADARVQWINHTIQQWCKDRSLEPEFKCYDLIVTHFVWDSIQPNELTGITQNIQKRMTRGGHWLLSDFDSSINRRTAAIVTVMYLFFYLTAGVQWRKLKKFNSLFESQHLQLHDQKEWMSGLIYSQIWTSL